MSRILALFLALFLAFALPVSAQEPQAPNYDAWNKLADQAEQILETGQANEARLQAIRNEVVKWRDQFKANEGVNSTRIATLKDQIAALGPLPAEGQTEAEGTAIAHDLMARLGVTPDQLVQGAYLDLLRATGSTGA